MITTHIVTPEDDLESLVSEINGAAWDDANEMTSYSTDALAAYLQRQDTVFVACHETVESGRTFLGMASSRIEMKPYDQELWLYVDEVDVCADHREKGAGTAIMRKLIEIAEANNCEELWLGTELDNVPANALYQSLDPDDVAQFVGYTFETDE